MVVIYKLFSVLLKQQFYPISPGPIYAYNGEVQHKEHILFRLQILPKARLQNIVSLSGLGTFPLYRAEVVEDPCKTNVVYIDAHMYEYTTESNMFISLQTTSPHALSTNETVYAALVLEIVITFGLVYTVYATAVDPRSKGNVGIIAPLAIGLIVAANILFAGAFSGGSMNPARSFGPALISGDFTNHWVYWVGPLIGAGLAGIIYEHLIISPPATHQLLHSEE